MRSADLNATWHKGVVAKIMETEVPFQDPTKTKTMVKHSFLMDTQGAKDIDYEWPIIV